MVSISLCMIVRDEEHTLGRCLDSVAGVADEIFVVDTGSVDGTKAVAESHGARVVDYPWGDDFAAARNYSFGQATKDYMLWLDADDVVLPEDRAKLLHLKETLDPGVDVVSMDYHIAFDGAGNPINSVRRWRLVRRDSDFRWVGVVHEDLEPGGEFTYRDSDIVVTHRKPRGEGGPSDRNLRIYDKHVAAGLPMRPVDLFHYGRELQQHQRFDEAIPYHRQFLESPGVGTDLALFTLHNLASCYYRTGQPDKEWECTLRSLDYDVPRPEFACRFGERFLNRGQYQQAAFWYELALRDADAPVDAWSVQNFPYQTWLPHKQLGLCYYQLGDYRRSLFHNEAARQYLPEDAEIASNIELLESLIAEGQAAAAP